MSMDTLKIGLIFFAVSVPIVWMAVFICVLSDQLRGYQAPANTEDIEDPLPTTVPKPWWKRVLLLPHYGRICRAYGCGGHLLCAAYSHSKGLQKTAII